MKRLSDDIEGDITENYSADVIILSSFGVFRGHAGVRESAAKLAAEIGDATFEYNHTIIETSCAFLEWTGESDKKIVRDGADTFVVSNEKIVMQSIHFSAVEK